MQNWYEEFLNVMDSDTPKETTGTCVGAVNHTNQTFMNLCMSTNEWIISQTVMNQHTKQN